MLWHENLSSQSFGVEEPEEGPPPSGPQMPGFKGIELAQNWTLFAIRIFLFGSHVLRVRVKNAYKNGSL